MKILTRRLKLAVKYSVYESCKISVPVSVAVMETEVGSKVVAVSVGGMYVKEVFDGSVS